MDGGDVGQTQRLDDLIQKVDALAQRVEQDKFGLRAQYCQGHTRKTSARAHVEHPSPLRHMRREGGAVEEMARHDLGRFGDCGEVHHLVLLQQQRGEFQQIINHFFADLGQKFLQPGVQQLAVGQAFSPFRCVSI